MTGISEVRARVNRREEWSEDAATLMKYIDSGQQVSEFAAFLLSNIGSSEGGKEKQETLNRWIRLNAEDFIRHLKR